MILIEDKTMCCGCSACQQICPQKCIEMKNDEEGFLYPKVDIEKCISCNACDTVCPIIKKRGTENDNESAGVLYNPPKAIGGWHRNEEIRYDSSSGGAFTLFAENIIKAGGIVVACELNSDLHAEHVAIEKIEDLKRLRGSKYVQSTIGQAYNKVQEALKKGRRVLFVGTPCQAAGLYSFLGNKKQENLFIVDFICHGVPSPAVFESFIRAETEKKGESIVFHRFRNKDKGWSQSGLQLGTKTVYLDGTETRRYPAFTDKYMNGFLDDLYLRPSCYDCKFKTIPKAYADFTIADFWGVDRVDSQLNDKRGTSLILINTEHGDKFWDEINGDFLYKEVEFEQAIARNKTLFKSAKMNSKREVFFEDYKTKGFDYVEKRYLSAWIWGMHKVFSMLGKFEQFVKFAIVGCSNTLINLIVYYVSLFLGVHYLIAYTLAFLISVCNAFFWNNRYVFKNKQEKSLIRAFIKVFSSYGVSFLLSLVLMSVMVELLHISSLVAPLLKLAVTIPINFFLNKFWAFKDRQ